MNYFLRYPTDGEPEKYLGSGRYYATLSQTEILAAAETEEPMYVLLFEAFDAEWFDRQTDLPEREVQALYRFYEYAQLFVLELHLPRSSARRFDAFETVEKFGSNDEEPDEWFSLTIQPGSPRAAGAEGIEIIVYSNLFAAGLAATLIDATYVRRALRPLLDQLTATDHVPDATAEQLDEAFVPLRALDYLTVFDVGQGNAIGLCNEYGAVEAYFDIGGGVMSNAKTFPPALRRFCFTANPPILLSHWDFDHWSSACRDWRAVHMTWIAPRQQVGAIHSALIAVILLFGRLLLMPSSWQSSRYGQLLLERCRCSGRNHSGIAVTVSQNTDGSGDQMLLPGDARYTCIPTFATKLIYQSVVAPHHGADMRNQQVPTSQQRPISRLVYSFGQNNTFQHPRPVTRQVHHCKGWTDRVVDTTAVHHEVRETPNRSTANLGHVYLRWNASSTPPPSPCFAQCQLQPQQI